MIRIFLAIIVVGAPLALPAMAQQPGGTVPESALTGPTYSLPQGAPPASLTPAPPAAPPSATAPQPGDIVPESALRGPAYALPQGLPPAHEWHPGDDVAEAYLEALQRVLPLHGYPAGPPTGRLDPTTERAIRDYQRDAGLTQDAHDVALLKATLDHITFSRPPVRRQPAPASTAAASPPSSAAPASPPAAAPAAAPAGLADPGTVRFVQQRLKAKGYDISANGMLDADTLNAIKLFQAANGLPGDGRIDNYLLDLLRK